MSEASHTSRVAAKWLENLERSKAQIAAGQTVPLLPVLDQLRVMAEHLEAEMGFTPDKVKPNPSR